MSHHGNLDDKTSVQAIMCLAVFCVTSTGLFWPANSAAADDAKGKSSNGAFFEDILLTDSYPGIGSPGDLQLLEDGRLLMSFDKDRGIHGRYSNDLGTTWGPEFVFAARPRPQANHCYVHSSFIKAANGDLLLLRTTGGRAPHRTPFVSAISTDDGKTWTNQRIIAGDPKETYGYPGVQFTDDMALIGFMSINGARLARISIDWFYGK